MQILKGKKDRMPEVNVYAGLQSSANQTVISLDKLADQSKAYKRSYETSMIGKTKSDVEQEWLDSRLVCVEDFIRDYPPNFGVGLLPSVTTEDGFWNTEVLLIATANWDSWTRFRNAVSKNLLEWAKWDGNSDPREAEENAIAYIKQLANNATSENK